jgi:hypothetical protein
MSGIIGTSHSKSKVIGRSKDTATIWISFNGGTFGIKDSFNVSSITDNGVGQYSVNFAITMKDTNYCGLVSVQGTYNNDGPWVGMISTKSTTTCLIRNISATGTFWDSGDHNLAIFGD